MKLSEIESNKYIKIIEFSLEKQKFSVEEACKESGMTIPEFSSAKYSLFMLKGEHEISHSSQDILTWHLSPSAYFHYLSFIQYKHAVKTSNKAHWVAIFSLAVSSIIGIASVVASFT